MQPKSNVQVAPLQKPQSRMTLANVRDSRAEEPIRAAIFGTEGVGKTTFAASAPSPIFLPGEEGVHHVDVKRFPRPESWADVLAAVQTLLDEPHEFKTFVIDTLDSIEPLVWRDVCEAAQVDSIEEVGGGYGKGYTAAIDRWRVLLSLCERLQKQKGVHLIYLAHAQIKSFKNPEGEPWDRYIMKLNEKAAGLFTEQCNCVLFARYEAFAAKQKDRRVLGVTTGARILQANWSPAFNAKNRFDLPDTLPLNWGDFFAAYKAGRPADPAKLTEAINAALVTLADPALETQVREAIAKKPSDAAWLAKIYDRLNAKLTAKGE